MSSLSAPAQAGDLTLTLAIATRKRPDMLAQTLESMLTCSPLPHELLVVDGDEDQSARPVVDRIAAAAGGLAVRYEASPPGLPLQRNRALDLAAGEIVFFADDDVDFDPQVFQIVCELYRAPEIVGATGRILEEDHRRRGNKRSRARRLIAGAGQDGTMTSFGYPRRLQDPETVRDVEFMEGCFMSARRDVARRVRFDERMAGYALAEDEDFSYRLSRVGPIRYDPRARIEHLNTGFKSFGSRKFNRMVVVNRAYLFRKNFGGGPWATVQFAAFVLMLVAHRALNGELDGVRGLLEGAAAAWRRRSAPLDAALG